jgi:hypothetical protein
VSGLPDSSGGPLLFLWRGVVRLVVSVYRQTEPGTGPGFFGATPENTRTANNGFGGMCCGE